MFSFARPRLGPVLPGAERYEFPLPVIHPEVREAAAKVSDRIRPGHLLRSDTLVVWWVKTVDAARALHDYLLSDVKVSVGFDFETVGWSPEVRVRGLYGGLKITNDTSPMHPEHRAMPATFQICWGQHSYVVSGELLHIFQPWLTQHGDLDIANVSFESAVCRNVGFELQRFYRDTVQMDFIAEETSRQRAHGLKQCMRDYLGFLGKSFEEVFGETPYLTALASDPAALLYAALDPFGTVFVADWLQAQLESMPCTRGGTLWDYYRGWERCFQTSLYRAEQTGIGISHPAIKAHDERIVTGIDEAGAQILKTVGRVINPSSAKDLADYYYREKGLKVSKTTNGFMCLVCGKQLTSATNNECSQHGRGGVVNKPSTDTKMLDLLAAQGDPLAKIVQKRRGLGKERGTWVDGYFRRAEGHDFAFPQLNGAHVVSGRLSGGDWLTTPEKLRDILSVPETPAAKAAIGLADGEDERIIGADYSQLELRLLAEITRDPVIIKTFQEGKDPHANTAAKIEIFNTRGAQLLHDEDLTFKVYSEIMEVVAISDAADKLLAELKLDADSAAAKALFKEKGLILTPVQKKLKSGRKKAKTVNFGIIYGMSVGALAVRIEGTVVEAKELYDVVWQLYTGAKTYYDMLYDETKAQGFMETLLGRRRRIFEFESEDEYFQGKARRLVQNQPCQAGAADVIRGAMLLVDIDIEAGGMYGRQGRGAYGIWHNGVWAPDWTRLPPEWRGQLPVHLQSGLGTLGECKTRLWLQIHDELDARCPQRNVELVMARMKALMTDPFGHAKQLAVPLKVSVKQGRTLAEVK